MANWFTLSLEEYTAPVGRILTKESYFNDFSKVPDNAPLTPAQLYIRDTVLKPIPAPKGWDKDDFGTSVYSGSAMKPWLDFCAYLIAVAKRLDELNSDMQLEAVFCYAHFEQMSYLVSRDSIMFFSHYTRTDYTDYAGWEGWVDEDDPDYPEPCWLFTKTYHDLPLWSKEEGIIFGFDPDSYPDSEVERPQ
jgi:hypothetical protein